MTCSLDICRHLVGRGRCSTKTLIADLPHIPESTLRDGLAKLKKRGLVTSIPIAGTQARLYEVTKAGRSHAETAEDRPGRPRLAPLPPKPRFGENIGRVRSVFDLPQAMLR